MLTFHEASRHHSHHPPRRVGFSYNSTGFSALQKAALEATKVWTLAELREKDVVMWNGNQGAFPSNNIPTNKLTFILGNDS